VTKLRSTDWERRGEAGERKWRERGERENGGKMKRANFKRETTQNMISKNAGGWQMRERERSKEREAMQDVC